MPFYFTFELNIFKQALIMLNSPFFPKLLKNNHTKIALQSFSYHFLYIPPFLSHHQQNLSLMCLALISSSSSLVAFLPTSTFCFSYLHIPFFTLSSTVSFEICFVFFISYSLFLYYSPMSSPFSTLGFFCTLNGENDVIY